MKRLPAAPIAALSLWALAALAAPPEGAYPRLSTWFESLRQPGSGISCCSIADCRPVDTRVGPAGYEAFIDDRWRPVPADKVLQGKDNPNRPRRRLLDARPRHPVLRARHGDLAKRGGVLRASA